MQDVKSEFYSFNFNEAIEGFLTIDEIKGTKIKSKQELVQLVNALQITKRHGKKRGHTYLQSLQKAY